MSTHTDADIVAWAQEVFSVESKEVAALIDRTDESFVKAVRMLFECKGRVIASGIGKTGIIAQKYAATIASTGTPSLFLHPAEAVHGDLGMVTDQDVVLIISYSGETDEIKVYLPYIKKIGAKIVAMTGNVNSFLAKHSDVTLDVKVEKEVCPLNLAPTTSTTVSLAMCDALAVAVQKLKAFSAKDFAMFHPRGSLGRKLLLTVEDAMRKGSESPLVKRDAKVTDVLLSITAAKAGAAIVVDDAGKVLGIFTDGDLRRHLGKDADLLKRPVGDVMTANPTVVRSDMLASEVMRILETKRIDEVPVVDIDGKAVGMLDIQDLLKAGVV
jgi:arabinose-5-phosphate isomerase